MTGPFDTPFESLPGRLPVFPLSGALLLPRCRLPLNIFEPRYLKMTEDALAVDRLIGIVQPVNVNSDASAPPLFETGCAGRITSFSETDDGRILIILTGVSRFRVAEELDAGAPYRQVAPDWQAFRQDLVEPADGAIDRDRLYASLRVYFEARDLDTDWDVLQDATDENLVNSLAMSCPFNVTEKQALLEADDLSERGQLMLSLLDMAALDQVSDDLPLH
jgi:Lon protease-like protein